MSRRLRNAQKKNESDPPPDRGSETPAVRYVASLEARIAAMREALAHMRPGSDAEALGVLRAAFPGSSLSERVAALTGEPTRKP
ncbi:MAG: hypothetical protein OEL76_07485 [Siculibacillus sp.]|nr:hypothetical protein [Siculibacillus sp.]